MNKLNSGVMDFFEKQGCVVVSTIDKDGFPHSSCKGIIKIDPEGKIFLLDVYRAKTLENLRRNPHMSITAVEEHKFIGYCLKGRAEIRQQDKFDPELIKAWEDRITNRLTQRLLKNIREERSHSHHPEALLPKPEYLIVMDVEEVVDLTPHHLK